MRRLLFSLCLLIPIFCHADDGKNSIVGFDLKWTQDFLQRYVGKWVGEYTLKNMGGEVLQTLQAEVIYQWDSTSKGWVLNGRAVYGTDSGIVVSESETLIANRQIFCIIKESGKQRTYRGSIDKKGKSIAWSPIDVENQLDESFRETFRIDAEGNEFILSQAYENVVRNGIENLLTMTGTLKRVPLDSAE